MDKNLSLDDLLLLTNEIARNVLAPLADEVDKTGKWPETQIRALQKAGLGGLVIPTRLGGHGQGLLSVAKVCEIMGTHCASTSMCFGMHLVASAVIASKATLKQEEKFLIPIAQGKHLTTLSLSEPGTGSNFYFPEAKLEKKKNGDFIINGTKSFVTNGSHADSYVVSAVIPDPNNHVGHFSCIVVPNQTDGIEWKAPWEGIGMKGNSSRNVVIKGLDLPAENLLGELGDQIWYVFEVVSPYFITAMAGTYLGIASAALQEAIEHLKNRTYTHSGASLSDQPVIQHQLGVLWARVESSRQLIYSAAAKADAGKDGALLSILSAKAEVADCVVNVVNEVMSLMGGTAYAHQGKLSRHLRDARASHVMAPTTNQLRTWTGRALLDLPLLSN